MPDLKTTITEVVTGLGMTGYPKLEVALKEAHANQLITNVSETEWIEMLEAHQTGKFKDEFSRAWDNGKVFLNSAQGLRGRVPQIIDWRGPTKPLASDTVPMDLRVDHVYAVSCKYNSNILHNTSPGNTFDNCLADQRVKSVDWYNLVAADEYQRFYEESVGYLGLTGFPEHIHELNRQQKDTLGQGLRNPGQWTASLLSSYKELCKEVSTISAAYWAGQIDKSCKPEEMYWRLIRLANVAYFMLGRNEKTPVRIRAMTPWDWKQAYEMKNFLIVPDQSAGQPVVIWQATIKEKATNLNHIVQGHVQIRWSHGKFSGPPEAKVYLDTPFQKVKGYVPLG